MKNTQRLQILNPEDISALYERPEFSDTERRHFFNLPNKLLERLAIKTNNGRRVAGIVYFILQYGYFKAKHQFFSVKFSDISKDIEFIMRHFLKHDHPPRKTPSLALQHRAKQEILSHTGFQADTERTRHEITEKLMQLVRRTQNPTEIFEEIIKHLNDNQCSIPPYTVLQDTIGEAFKNNDRALVHAVNDQLPVSVKSALDYLLNKNDKNYLITFLKFDAKTFQKNQMQSELQKLTLCKPIYEFAKQLLPSLDLSNSLIKHYSSLISLYQVARLKKTPKPLAYLYMVCYVVDRFERITNNLVQAFAYHVDNNHENAKSGAKLKMPSDPGPLENYECKLGELISLYTNKEVMKGDGPSIAAQAFIIMPEEQITTVSQKLIKSNKSRAEKEQALIWDYHRMHNQSVRINLRPIFEALEFNETTQLRDLFKAHRFWKKLLKHNKSITDYPIARIPMNHIHPKSLRNSFISTIPHARDRRKNRKIVNANQYEFYLYRALRECIRSRKVAINTSIDFKSFDEQVKKPKDWKTTKQNRLENLNNKFIMKPIKTILNELESTLESAIERTNRRAVSGDNKAIKITRHRNGKTSWTMPYPKKNTEIDNPFYDKLDIKTISELFDFVDHQTSFMKALTHIKPRGGGNEFDYLAVKGAILANGTLQGTHAFAKRSNVSYNRLAQAEDNHIRLKTLRSSADILIDQMLELPVFNLYLLSNNKHGSADGTKRKLRRRLLKARYSSKYFGTDVGMVLMTMGLGHIPFATRVIGANEHESHYIFPMMIQSSHIVDPDIISTDTAGTNNINDLLYFAAGKVHAPCYRSLVDRASKICGFKPLSQYNDFLIKPSHTVNKQLIIDKWPEILPILYSLFSHDSNQEKIIQQLSSHDFKSGVKDAIWELNLILKSIHILKYIDEPQYQRDIRTSLNRGEAYHLLLKSIGDVGGGDFRGMSEMEVEIWNECMRLIALIIIFYNMSLLSRLLSMKKSQNDEAAIKFLEAVSPVASQHFNLSGLYEFSEERAEIDVESVVAMMEEILSTTVEKMTDQLLVR